MVFMPIPLQLLVNWLKTFVKTSYDDERLNGRIQNRKYLVDPSSKIHSKPRNLRCSGYIMI